MTKNEIQPTEATEKNCKKLFLIIKNGTKASIREREKGNNDLIITSLRKFKIGNSKFIFEKYSTTRNWAKENAKNE